MEFDGKILPCWSCRQRASEHSNKHLCLSFVWYAQVSATNGVTVSHRPAPGRRSSVHRYYRSAKNAWYCIASTIKNSLEMRWQSCVDQCVVRRCRCTERMRYESCSRRLTDVGYTTCDVNPRTTRLRSLIPNLFRITYCWITCISLNANFLFTFLLISAVFRPIATNHALIGLVAENLWRHRFWRWHFTRDASKKDCRE